MSPTSPSPFHRPPVPTDRRARLALLACLLQAAAVPVLAEPAAPTEERWYVTSIAGEAVGSVRETLAVGEAGGLVSTTELRLVLNRMGNRIEMSTRAAFRESAAGRLESVEVEIRMSDQATRTRAEVGPEGVTIHQEAGGRSFSRTVPVAGEVLGPEAVRRLTAARLAAAGDELRYLTFSPDLAAVTEATRRVLAVEEVASQGLRVRALKLEERLEASPLPTTLWLSPDGRLLRMEQAGPLGIVEVVASDAATAARAAEGGELPEESYGATLVRTGLRIPRPRSLESMTVELRHRNPALGWPDLSGPGQRVLRATDDTRVLEVTRRRPAEGVPFPVPVTDELRPYLAPNAYLQSEDPALVATAREVVAGETDLFRAALALERWTAEAMSFDLGVVLAPSVEVFENRRGTCTEYAVLLAALTRAVGIPSRVAMGFVYLGGILGGHAWVEVLVGEAWIPLDAAVVADGPADAARFAFVRTSLEEGPGPLNLGPAAQMFGQIDARLLELGWADGTRRILPADAAPYTLDGDRFRDTGLGVGLARPAGFTFTDLDAVWPDDTVVAVTGPQGGEARLAVRRRLPWADPEAAAREELARLVPGGEPAQAEAAGRPALRAEGEGRAALAVPGSEETWLLVAEGPDAAGLLDRLAAGLELPDGLEP